MTCIPQLFLLLLYWQLDFVRGQQVLQFWPNSPLAPSPPPSSDYYPFNNYNNQMPQYFNAIPNLLFSSPHSAFPRPAPTFSNFAYRSRNEDAPEDGNRVRGNFHLSHPNYRDLDARSRRRIDDDDENPDGKTTFERILSKLPKLAKSIADLNVHRAESSHFPDHYYAPFSGAQRQQDSPINNARSKRNRRRNYSRISWMQIMRNDSEPVYDLRLIKGTPIQKVVFFGLENQSKCLKYSKDRSKKCIPFLVQK